MLVDPTDTASIGKAFAAIMRAPAERRAAMGLKSRRIVDPWGPDRFADGLARAADAAMVTPRRRLAAWDGLVLRALSRRSMSRVS
jgi:hypothetical protein